MKTRLFLLAVLGLLLVLTAVVGAPRPRRLDADPPLDAADRARNEEESGPDELVSRWTTASGRVVECAERRRGSEPAERWLLRAIVRGQRLAEELPPLARVDLPRYEAGEPRLPRLTCTWVDGSGVEHVLFLHQDPRLSATLWAIDVWLAQSFLERELPPAPLGEAPVTNPG